MSQHPRRRPDVVVDPAADGFLARAAHVNSVTWLNRTAYLVFELCTGDNDVEMIARALEDAFELTRSPLPSVRDTVADLIAAGIVAPGDHAVPAEASLVIAVWSPGGAVAPEALTQVTRLLNDAEDADIPARLVSTMDRSMRVARNRTASRLVQEAVDTHILFLDTTRDAMRAIAGVSLAHLLRSPHEVIGIPVALGEPAWEAARQASATLPDLTAAELAQYARGYDLSFSTPPDPDASEDGFIEARHCNSGALLVRRSALERIAGSSSVNRHRGNVVMGGLSMDGGWGFFDPGLSDDAIDIDEDLAFAERLRAAGGRLMVDATGGFGVCLRVGKRMLARAT